MSSTIDFNSTDIITEKNASIYEASMSAAIELYEEDPEELVKLHEKFTRDYNASNPINQIEVLETFENLLEMFKSKFDKDRVISEHLQKQKEELEQERFENKYTSEAEKLGETFTAGVQPGDVRIRGSNNPTIKAADVSNIATSSENITLRTKSLSERFGNATKNLTQQIMKQDGNKPHHVKTQRLKSELSDEIDAAIGSYDSAKGIDEEKGDENHRRWTNKEKKILRRLVKELAKR